MSNELMDFLGQQKDRFLALDTAQLLDFKQECLFARQQIMKNDYTFKAAEKNPQSLQAAILNVAAIGISLNPASAHAYLVPRDNSICLDISYKGLVKLATDCGAIKDCKSVLVYETDDFKWLGPYKEPEHSADVFSKERGEVKGAYNIAYLHDGRVMVEVMRRADLDKIKATSKAANGPWKTWEDQMQLKSVTKRAYKSWPQTENRQRLDRAIAVLHETEGTAFTLEEQAEYLDLLRSGNALQFYLFNHTISEDKAIALYNSFDRNHKTKDKARVDELDSAGREALENVAMNYYACEESEDADGMQEIRADFTDNEWELVCQFLPHNSAGRQNAA